MEPNNTNKADRYYLRIKTAPHNQWMVPSGWSWTDLGAAVEGALKADAQWMAVELIDGETGESVEYREADEPSEHKVPLGEALKWAAQADAGEYLVHYEDTGLTADEDPGSRCGYDDSELDAIRKVLRERDLTLTADDRGLCASQA